MSKCLAIRDKMVRWWIAQRAHGHLGGGSRACQTSVIQTLSIRGFWVRGPVVAAMGVVLHMLIDADHLDAVASAGVVDQPPDPGNAWECSVDGSGAPSSSSTRSTRSTRITVS